jgi:hypothetical protein
MRFHDFVLVPNVLDDSWQRVDFDRVSCQDNCLWIRCDRLPSSTGMVRTRYDAVRVCFPIPADEVDSFNFQDGDNGNWSDDFEEVEVDGDGSYCRQWIAEREEYYQWEDGSWSTSPEPEPEPEPDYAIPSYHSQRPSWRILSSGLLWGVEIEVDTYGSEERAELANDTFSRDVAVVEMDGSLDSETGAEIVFAPVTFDVLVGDFTKHLATIKNFCKNHRQTAEHGMHLNIDLQNFSGELHQLKFAHFLNECDDLTISAAGRSATSFAQKSLSPLTEKKRLGKYRFVCFHENRAEVRIFLASLNKYRFLVQCLYAKAAIEFTNLAGIRELSAERFLTWLKSTVCSEYRLLRVYFGVDSVKDSKLVRKNDSEMMNLERFSVSTFDPLFHILNQLNQVM